MRILWLTVDRSKRVTNHFDEFRNTVEQYAEVITLTKDPTKDGGMTMGQASLKLTNNTLHIDNIVLDYLNKDWSFDFIFCDAFFAYLNEPFELIDIPKGILIEDVHGSVIKTQINKAKDKEINYIFHRYNFAFHKLYPSAKTTFKCIWLPHSVNINKFEPTKKLLKVLHTGTISKYYPHRTNVVNKLIDKSYFTYMERLRDWSPKEIWPTGSDYYKALSSANICITGGSIFNIPTLKYIEILCAKSALMSNWFPELGLLGFYPDVNMLTYIDDEVVESVESALTNDKIEEISNNGYDLIKLNHTSDIRAKQFLNNISNFIYDKDIYPNTKPISNQVNFTNNSSQINQSKPILNSKPKTKLNTKNQVSKPHKQKPPQGKRIVPNTGWKSRIK